MFICFNFGKFAFDPIILFRFCLGLVVAVSKWTNLGFDSHIYWDFFGIAAPLGVACVRHMCEQLGVICIYVVLDKKVWIKSSTSSVYAMNSSGLTTEPCGTLQMNATALEVSARVAKKCVSGLRDKNETTHKHDHWSGKQVRLLQIFFDVTWYNVKMLFKTLFLNWF